MLIFCIALPTLFLVESQKEVAMLRVENGRLQRDPPRIKVTKKSSCGAHRQPPLLSLGTSRGWLPINHNQAKHATLISGRDISKPTQIPTENINPVRNLPEY